MLAPVIAVQFVPGPLSCQIWLVVSELNIVKRLTFLIELGAKLKFSLPSVSWVFVVLKGDPVGTASLGAF